MITAASENWTFILRASIVYIGIWLIKFGIVVPVVATNLKIIVLISTYRLESYRR